MRLSMWTVVIWAPPRSSGNSISDLATTPLNCVTPEVMCCSTRRLKSLRTEPRKLTPWESLADERERGKNFEIGRLLQLKSEIRNFRLNQSETSRLGESNLRFRISDLSCRSRPISKFAQRG